ncbi:MAG: oxidoreductase [Myxococcaceae bacterium]|nr:oxidoreductase [Myxococcaceae bacterium]
MSVKGRLEGKRILVTGAASGIGRASAQLFAREGASLLLADWAEQSLTETYEAIRAATDHTRIRVACLRADAGSEADVTMLLERATAELGGLDGLFANAGITGTGTGLDDTSVEQFQEVLRVNLLGPFLILKHGSALLRQQGSGSIVCTASVAGMNANAGPIAYSASKAGVINLVRTAAHDLRGSGVRVNAICPGLIETGMTQSWFDYARARGSERKLGQFAPLERPGQPGEVAQAAVFLLSDESSYVHGHALVVDGGLTASVPYLPPRK